MRKIYLFIAAAVACGACTLFASSTDSQSITTSAKAISTRETLNTQEVSTSSQNQEGNNVAEEESEFVENGDVVYLCMGPNSKCYHSSTNCKGLSSCSTEIKSVSEATARNEGRRACKICY